MLQLQAAKRPRINPYRLVRKGFALAIPTVLVYLYTVWVISIGGWDDGMTGAPVAAAAVNFYMVAGLSALYLYVLRIPVMNIGRAIRTAIKDSIDWWKRQEAKYDGTVD